MQPLAFYHELYTGYAALNRLSGIDILRKVPDLGRRLKMAGFQTESDQCFEVMVTLLKQFVAEGNAHGAIITENQIYDAFVKTTESEDHYFKCFSRWSPLLVALGRRHRRPLTPRRDWRKLCFVLQAAVLLGHTQVMLTMIDAWRALGIEVDIHVAALGAIDPAFVVELTRRGIPFIPPTGPKGEEIPIGQSVLMLRDRLQTAGIHTVVWTTSPSLASYALTLKLAPRQVMWSVKFHPVHLEDVDVHICGGHEVETTRRYNGRDWTVSPFPLTLVSKDNVPDDVARIRNGFPAGSILLGVLAREEKLCSPAYLMAVGSLLVQNPRAHFIWTGRTQPEMVTSAFASFGISDRCHFVGWVDTNLYAEALDIFLETFPFGCGITGFQALAHGTPLVSMRCVDTLYGLMLEGAITKEFGDQTVPRAHLESLDIVTAADPSHYIDIVQRMMNDEAYRHAVGQREKAYFERERDAVPRYARRLWTTITGDGS